MGYEHDDLLEGHLQKEAFIGALGRMAMPAAKGAFNFGRGFMGMGGKGLAAGAGTAASIAIPVAGAMGLGSQPQPPPPQKIAHPLVDKLAMEVLGDDFSPTHRARQIASYGAFMLPYMSERIHSNKPLSTALNAAGLAGLGYGAGKSLMKGDMPSAYDLAGLASMGAGMLHEHLRPHPAVPAH